jgi:hypothetical protein
MDEGRGVEVFLDKAMTFGQPIDSSRDGAKEAISTQFLCPLQNLDYRLRHRVDTLHCLSLRMKAPIGDEKLMVIVWNFSLHIL